MARAKWAHLGSIAPEVRLHNLRGFLANEAVKGNLTALHLLNELHGKPGAVKA